jgi:hypothetical protein
METIKIAHLYYDLMNLYGENGNLRVLVKHLENQDIKVTTHFLTIDDEIDFTKYDIFYLGSGSKENFELVLNDIKKYHKDIKNAIAQNKFFIVTGNSLDLFGKYYVDLNGNEHKCLDVLDYDSHETDFRIVGEQTFKFHNLEDVIIGFQNRNCVLKNVNEPHLFEVDDGTGYLPKSNYEGILKNNFYGTYLLGPILARNPHFTEYIVKKIVNNKNLSYKKWNDIFETIAYKEYVKSVVTK